MPSTPPSTTAEILETGNIDSEFAAALEAEPIPPGTNYTLADLKQQSASALAPLQERLSASRPPDITETEHLISLRDNYRSRIIICHLTCASERTTPAPLIILFHGGGHCVGHPETELPLARELASTH
ncbi:hypothetical protein LTR44_003763 [Exophiala sp. CCFEE 6388]|nr:hypothetical protein LTR44_003763 [Eurotiomycetes sp. CCFEE 6388]